MGARKDPLAVVPYESDTRFSLYYLEDSYVLSIEESEQSISFDLDCVLTPEHPDYHAALPNEQHCYRHAILSFEGISSVNWKKRGTKFSVDADGTKDFGNIDSFFILPGNMYALQGAWGELELGAQESSITLVPAGGQKRTPG